MKLKAENAILSKAEHSVFCGITKESEAVFIKPSQRTMHTQVVGTTNAGKTESVILPWAIQDMEQGRGLILIDGKSDRSLRDKLYSYAKKFEREDDFRFFLSQVSLSLINSIRFLAAVPKKWPSGFLTRLVSRMNTSAVCSLRSS